MTNEVKLIMNYVNFVEWVNTDPIIPANKTYLEVYNSLIQTKLLKFFYTKK